MTDHDLLCDPRRGCAPGKADPELFFGVSRDLDGDRVQTSYTEAIKICKRRCPADIRAACDRYATETRQTHGVWGGRVRTPKDHHVVDGRTEAELRELRREEKRRERERRRRRFDAEVAARHARGTADQNIAFALGVSARHVTESRRRQDLPALFGPGGRRLQPQRVSA